MSISYRQVIWAIVVSQLLFAIFNLEPDRGIGVPRRRGWTAYISVSSEVLQELYLAQSPLGQDLLAENIGDLLDGDALVGLVVDGGTVK